MAAGAAVFPEEVLPCPQPNGSATMAREANPLARFSNLLRVGTGETEQARDLIMEVNAKGRPNSQKNGHRPPLSDFPFRVIDGLALVVRARKNPLQASHPWGIATPKMCQLFGPLASPNGFPWAGPGPLPAN
jgi:hypothetical protein